MARAGQAGRSPGGALLFRTEAADSAPGEQRLAAAALGVYRERCARHVRELSVQLDSRNAALDVAVSAAPRRGLRAQVEAAWREGPEARRVFRNLLEAPATFTRWAGAAGCPGWFDVRRDVVDRGLEGKQWEAVRPLLLPAFCGVTLLGWDYPERDAVRWQRDEGRSYEWFLLLRSLTSPPDDARDIDRDWVRAEVGASWAEECRASGVPRSFFHGQYKYLALADPSRAAGVPRTRANAVARRLCWEARSNDVAAFRGFLEQKEALLGDLLELVAAGHDTEPAAVDWFVCGAGGIRSSRG